MRDKPGSQAGTVMPFTALRQQQLDWLELMRHQHNIHALLEVDVTRSRQSLKAFRRASKSAMSFTAYVVWCVAQAVDADRSIHACRHGRSRLVLFDEVDVTVLVERQVQDASLPVPYIVHAANRKRPEQIHQEISRAQATPAPLHKAERWMPLWLCLPAFMRQLFWRCLLRNAYWRKRTMGTVAVSALGMFGRGPAWGIPLTPYTLCVTLGGITRRPITTSPGSHGSTVESPATSTTSECELLSLTISVDHAIVDGAPAARFAQRLRELLEAGLQANPEQPYA